MLWKAMCCVLLWHFCVRLCYNDVVQCNTIFFKIHDVILFI